MNQRSLTLNATERAALEAIRDHDRRPYLRERAAALLKIADGLGPTVVARQGLLKPRHPEQGLLKPRHPETVCLWLNDYEVTRTVRPRPATRRTFSPSGHRGGPDARISAPESPPLGD